VYDLTLARYPGAARIARNVLAFVFILSASRILANAWGDPNWRPAKTAFDAERDLRIVQITVLLGLVALLRYYAVPAGRNLNGIIAGYATFLAASVSHLSVIGSLGHVFPKVWQNLQPVAYITVLLIWCGSLWHYAPAAESEAVASSVALVLNQRLLRRLCSQCNGRGCADCFETGYRGRIPALEILRVSDSARPKIARGDLEGLAAKPSLSEQAAGLVREGRTDEKEVARVLGVM